MRGSEVSGLEELMTICAMCNDSSVDYNEVNIYAYKVDLGYNKLVGKMLAVCIVHYVYVYSYRTSLI